MPKIGNKNNNNTSVPTLAEYITTQIANKRAAALDKSRNRTSVKVPMVVNHETEEEWKNRINDNIRLEEELLSRMMAEYGNSNNFFDRRAIQRRQNLLDELLKEKDKGYSKLIPGANCMYNAGDCYGLNIPGNQTFAAKHKEKGFKRVNNSNMEPGDIVQDNRTGTPIHAMVYDSKDVEGNLRFNYARGSSIGDINADYVKQGKYPLPLKDYAIYRFVGTPADSTQWINEYKQQYGNSMRCGGRRKAQLGLDIREGGIAIPIANNMFYIDGRKHAAGGVAIGPNNKNGVEVEGGEVVEMIDSNHPSVGRQFKAGGQQQTMRVFSSVPFLRGASPAELVLGGANPDAVFKAQEEFKDRNRINDDGTTYEMGGERKSKSRRSRPVTGVLPYGYTIRNLYAVENPYRKGIKGNVVKMYDSRTLGAGVDVVSGHPELYKKAKSGKMTKKQADETAVIHLRKDDNAIRSNYADVYGKAAADTLSYGPRFLVAQARYQQGNVRKAWQPIHKAMAKGDAKALKKAVLQVTPKDHTYRRKWIEDFKVYKMGGMIYEINGNVKNGLGLRSKAKYGLATKYLKKKDKTTEKPVENKQKDEPKVLDIRNTASYKIKQAAENPWVKYPVEVASYLLTGATAKGMNLIGKVGKKAAKEVVDKTDDVIFKFGKTRKNKEDIILNTVDEVGISNRFTKPVETTISYKPQTRFRDGKTYVVKEKTIKKVAEKRFSPKKEVTDKNITTYTPPKNNTTNAINFEDAIIVRKQMDPKTSRELDKVYRKAVGNKEPKSGFGRIPQQTTIEYTPKGESIRAYDASVEFHKRVSDMLYDSYVKKYGKKGVDKAMKREHISKYEYGGRIKAEGGKFLKYKNGVFTDPDSGEEYDVDPEVFKMYGNSFEEGVIPFDDRQYRGKLRVITNPRKQSTGDSYVINPLTGEWIRNGVTETPEPSVKGTTKVTSKPSSTARGRGTKVSTPKAASQSTPTIQDTVNKITMDAWKASKSPKVDLSKAKMPSYNVSDLGSKETKEAKAKLNTSSTGGGTQSKEAPWVPQYNTITGKDWIGVGTNLAGHIASYFANNSLLKKAPMPTKPVSFQAAKLKTTHNINPELANVNEVAQMNLAEVGRNTSSSSTSLARKQRVMNEARDAKNKLYGQKENIETQLINLDKRNRQDVYNRNIAAYNDWLDKTYVAKSNNLLNKQRNLTNLISGIPSAVNNMLGIIETRKSTNDMIHAITAPNPNVDGRLLGIGDYYTQKQSNGRTAVYNKNHKLVKYV